MPWDYVYDPIKGSDKDWAIRKKVRGKWRIVGRSRTEQDVAASVRIRRQKSHEGQQT